MALAADMTPETCARYVAAFLHHLETTGPRMLLVGRDLRAARAASLLRLGPARAEAAMAAIRAQR